MLEDETQRSIQEWTIPYDELSFGKKIVDHPTHSVFSGKWHGDVIIHTFETRYVQFQQPSKLVHILTENC